MALSHQTVEINGNSITLKGSEPTAKAKYALLSIDNFTKTIKKALEATGSEVTAIVSEKVFLCRAPPNHELKALHNIDGIDSVDIYPPEVKIHGLLRSQVAEKLKETGGGEGPPPESVRVRIRIHLHTRSTEKDRDEVVGAIKSHDPKVADLKVFTNMINVDLDSSKLEKLASIESIWAIEPRPKLVEDNNFAADLMGISDMSKHETPYFATGEGELISVCDSGFNVGDPKIMHDGFTPLSEYHYFCMFHDKAIQECMADHTSHGTHIAGSALGNSQDLVQDPMRGPVYLKGTAPKATLLMTQLFRQVDGKEVDWQGPFDDMVNKSYNSMPGVLIYNHSCGVDKVSSEAIVGYDLTVMSCDNRIFKDNILFVQSAGNNRLDLRPGICGWYAAAKNVLTVGACVSSRPSRAVEKTYVASALELPGDPYTMASFSCSGTHAKRLKPDLVAPGTAILSAKAAGLSVKEESKQKMRGVIEDKRYTFMNGTSQATALVTGCAASLNQALKKSHPEFADPSKFSGALLKAVLINGAVPLERDFVKGGQYISGTERWWGWGRVNLTGSLQHLGRDGKPGTWSTGSIGLHEEISWEVECKATEVDLTGETLVSSIKATLVWLDPAVDLLVCRLYFTLTHLETGSTWIGNCGQKTAEEAAEVNTYLDQRNNVQQIQTRGLDIGKYRFTIRFHRTTEPDFDRVRYAVAWKVSEAACSWWM